jgi:MoxR-like ATPase
MNQDIAAINAKIEEESVFVDQVKAEIGKVIVGQSMMIDRLLIGLLCKGHVLLEGVPGLAKTLAVKSLSNCFQTKFQRLQFTPDLLPADLLGTLVYNQKTGAFDTKKGPIFANLILADEINRAPAKVQSALLEAMQERQVTIGETTFPLEEPFLVLATQNPIEQEGTYPLPEAQVDRFMLKVTIGYPTKEEELEIMRRQTAPVQTETQPIVTPQQLLQARAVVSEVYIDEKIERYIIDLVFATRNPGEYGLKDSADLIRYGASPRSSIYLALAAKAHAFLSRRGYVTPEDVRAIAQDVLRHRVQVTYEAEAEEVSAEDVVRQVIHQIEVP